LYPDEGVFRKKSWGELPACPTSQWALFLRGADFFFAGFFLAVDFVFRGVPLKMLSQPVEYLTFEPV
jgi:hypothetical protein